jgi:hypothetical protein
MSRAVLDAGAFVAFEKGDARVRAFLLAARRLGFDVSSTSPVVAQVWRDGRRQVLLARLAAATRVHAPDIVAAQRAGELLTRTKTKDVVDALLVGIARDGDTVLTSDPADIGTLLAASGVQATVVAV